MSRTLLLADDSVTIQKIVGLTFANEDIRLVTVDNGDDALIRARALQPDLILADVSMPGLSGYELCAAIREDTELAHTPVLLLTGSFERVDERLAEESGVSDFIAKPFEAHALVSKVETLLQASPQPVQDPEPATFGSAPQVVLGPADQEPLPSSDAPDPVFGDETVLSSEPIVALTPGGRDGSEQDLEEAPGASHAVPSPDSPACLDDDPFYLELPASSQDPLPEPPAEAGPGSCDEPLSLTSLDDSKSGVFGELPLTDSDDLLTSWATNELTGQGGVADRQLLDPTEPQSPDETETHWVPEAHGDTTIRWRGAEPDPVPVPGRDARAPAASEATAVVPAFEASGSPTTAAISPASSSSPPQPGFDEERLAQEMNSAIEKVAWDAFGPLSEQIVSQVIRKLEEIAWETVPQIAERLVRAEIERLKHAEDPEG